MKSFKKYLNEIDSYVPPSYSDKKGNEFPVYDWSDKDDDEFTPKYPCPDCPDCLEPPCTHCEGQGSDGSGPCTRMWCNNGLSGWYRCTPDDTPRLDFPLQPSYDVYNLIWWLIHLKYPWLDDNAAGRLLLRMKGYSFPNEPDCTDGSAACQAQWDAYLEALYQLLSDMLGDAFEEYWDEYQDWLEDNQGGTFWDWLQEQDWWPF
jgi:hypothetical protein